MPHMRIQSSSFLEKYIFRAEELNIFKPYCASPHRRCSGWSAKKLEKRLVYGVQQNISYGVPRTIKLISFQAKFNNIFVGFTFSFVMHLCLWEVIFCSKAIVKVLKVPQQYLAHVWWAHQNCVLQPLHTIRFVVFENRRMHPVLERTTHTLIPHTHQIPPPTKVHQTQSTTNN